jgi:hypothetical protein
VPVDLIPQSSHRGIGAASLIGPVKLDYREVAPCYQMLVVFNEKGLMLMKE